MPAKPSRRVYIVDPDAAAGAALRETLSSLGYDVRNAVSASAFITARSNGVACVLVDVSSPEASAFDLQQRLLARGADVGIVFTATHADIPTVVAAMKRGAIDFLLKPLHLGELVAAVEAALAHGQRKRDARRSDARTAARLARLTPREHEVFALVVQGKRNKAIADELGSRESTVKVHRSRLMRKLEVTTLADLLRIGNRHDLLSLDAPPGRRGDHDTHALVRRSRRAGTPAPLPGSDPSS